MFDFLQIIASELGHKFPSIVMADSRVKETEQQPRQEHKYVIRRHIETSGQIFMVNMRSVSPQT